MKRAGLPLFVLVAAAFGLGWWFVMPGRVSGERGSALEETSSVSSNHEEALLPASGPAPMPPTESSGSAPAVREAAEDSTPRAPVHGRLVREEDGTPLEAVKHLLLASEGDRVSESLLTDERGRFTTTRAFPRGELRAWVREARTKALLGRHMAFFDPEAEEEWPVVVPTPSKPEPPARTPLVADPEQALVTLRVVDLAGLPRANVLVKFVPERPELVYTRAETDREGVLEVILEPGPWRISGGAPFARLPLSRHDFAAGSYDLGDLVLPLDSDGAYLAGVVVVPDEDKPEALVFARELASGRESFVWAESSQENADGEASFRIDDLPAGRYEVSVLSYRVFAPESRQALAPCEGLRFVASTASKHGFRFDVRAAGEPVPEFVVLGSLRGSWVEALDGGQTEVPAVYEQWIVLAPGFRPARGRFTGDEPLVERDEGDTEVHLVRVDLTPGQGQALVCLDIEGEGPCVLEIFGRAVHPCKVSRPSSRDRRSAGATRAGCSCSRASATLRTSSSFFQAGRSSGCKRTSSTTPCSRVSRRSRGRRECVRVR